MISGIKRIVQRQVETVQHKVSTRTRTLNGRTRAQQSVPNPPKANEPVHGPVGELDTLLTMAKELLESDNARARSADESVRHQTVAEQAPTERQAGIAKKKSKGSDRRTEDMKKVAKMPLTLGQMAAELALQEDVQRLSEKFMIVLHHPLDVLGARLPKFHEGLMPFATPLTKREARALDKAAAEHRNEEYLEVLDRALTRLERERHARC